MRSWGLIVGSLALVLGSFHSARAQDWPARNVTVVVPLAAGTSVDSIARLVMQQVGQQVRQSFIIENRPGAGGTLGTSYVAKAAPDGYTLLVYGAAASAAAIYAKLPYDTLADITPVAALGQQPLVIVAPAGRFKSMADLVAQAKAKPGALNFSTPGVGSAAHLGATKIMLSAGFVAQHVPFRGDYIVEVVAGRIDFSVAPVGTVISLIRDGKLAALAVSASKRSFALPDVPTLLEAGLKDDAIYPFYIPLFAPARTPAAILDKLHAEVGTALSAPTVHDRAAALGFEPMPMSRTEMREFFRRDVAANEALVESAKIPKQQ
ncbi:MAG TPA: tripartite tricarboxylate transporter substrate-binding protein [Xanthobacteraceae bacterium]|nr:tripartite tricarboxylate transporter substrate-binding protein [Xanthobacteraceae bacterium]